MKKTEWIEQHEEDLKRYDKPLFKGEEDYEIFMRNYEMQPIISHEDGSVYGGDDWYEPMGYFKD